MNIEGAGNSRNLGGSGGRHPQIILKSRTPEIRFPAFLEVIFYRKAHYKKFGNESIRTELNSESEIQLVACVLEIQKYSL